jgi:hypothetical protein
MNEPIHHRDDRSDVESLIRAAGSYVRPSEELRPRVLEASRVELGERKAQRRIWQVAIAICLLGTMYAVAGDRTPVPPAFSHGMLQVGPEVRTADGGGAGWRIVEAFTDLRRRQAALLSLNRQSP